MSDGEAPPRGVSSRSTAELRALIVEHYEFVWRSLRRLGVRGPEVEDAAQQVLLVFGQRIAEVRIGSERAYLFGTAMRVAADHRKKQARSREILDSEGLDAHASHGQGADELLDRQRARALLDTVLEELPDDLRAVFVLFELEEITAAEIAEMLEIPAGTVASRLRRARELFERGARRMR